MSRVRSAIISSSYLLCTYLLLASAAAPRASAQPSYPPLEFPNFTSRVGPAHTADPSGSGFGDRQNSWAWSMAWFKGKLLVGTNRAYNCMEMAGMDAADPTGLVVYPPRDPDISCAPDPGDLPSAAQIWSYDPTTKLWTKVFESPMDVPIPSKPGKFVARDVGFRGMHVHRFTDSSNVQRELLMVSGVNSAFYLGNEIGAARLLWSENGTTFTPIERTGTIFSTFHNGSFRGAATYKNKFYVIAGTIAGFGVVVEADDPRVGTSYRVYSPPGMSVYEVKNFAGYLWLGTHKATGFELFKASRSAANGGRLTIADVTKVMDFGGNHPLNQGNNDVISMHVFNGRLYVGGNSMNNWKGAELFRVTPGATPADPDEWEVVSGKSRTNLNPAKLPLSGFDVGMGWPLNQHMWRMETFDGRLYLGTFDLATPAKNIILLGLLLEKAMGFDLFSTEDGVTWNVVDRGGFVRTEACLALTGPLCQGLNFGVRTMAATPMGLWLGTANYFYGLQLWLGQPTGWTGASARTATSRPAPPADLAVETKAGARLLSWEPVPNAIMYQIWRSDGTKVDLTNVAKQPMTIDVHPDLRVVGATAKPMYVDKVANGVSSHYAVVAIGGDGKSSPKSNVVPVPYLGEQPTFTQSLQLIARLKARHRVTSDIAYLALLGAVNTARTEAMKGNITPLITLTAQVRANNVQNMKVLDRYGSEDLARALSRLTRRVQFAIAGEITLASLN